jgi:hypothetical protein
VVDPRQDDETVVTPEIEPATEPEEELEPVPAEIYITGNFQWFNEVLLPAAANASIPPGAIEFRERFGEEIVPWPRLRTLTIPAQNSSQGPRYALEMMQGFADLMEDISLGKPYVAALAVEVSKRVDDAYVKQVNGFVRKIQEDHPEWPIMLLDDATVWVIELVKKYLDLNEESIA